MRIEIAYSQLRRRQGSVRTVALLLGPYRNLTTLVVSVASLHPQTQVLNHASKRVFPFPSVDFLCSGEERTLRRFVRYAIQMSAGGRFGPWGGSALRSHAFHRERLRSVYRARYGDRLVKRRITAVLWKESMLVTNHLRDHDTSIEALAESLPRLRFIYPIRNPLDCARSNLTTGHVVHLRAPSESVTDVVDTILDEIASVAPYAAANPDRFLFLHESELGRDQLLRLGRLLDLAPDQRWLDDALACCEIDSSYEHPDDIVDHYRSAVVARFPDGELRRKLLGYVDDGSSSSTQESSASYPNVSSSEG